MNPQTKLFVPILDNGLGMVMADFMVSLMGALNGLSIQMHRAGDSHPNRGMNKISNDFLATDCTHMLVVDGDIICRGEDIRHLIEDDRPLVYGGYPKRQPKTELVAAAWTDDPPQFDGPLAFMRRCGRGFMLVAREVFERMKEDHGGPALRYHNHGRVEWDFWPSGVVVGQQSTETGTDADGYPRREWISEDWYFDERCHALGIPVLLDWRVMTRHEGYCAFPIAFSPEMVPDILSGFSSAEVAAFAAQADAMRALDRQGSLSRVQSWQDIPGWFDFEPLYREFAAVVLDGGRFCEVGVWLGRSLAAFHQFAKEAGKRIELHAVDTFKGSPGDPDQQPTVDFYGGSILSAFEANMRCVGLNGELHIKEADSSLAAASYSDQYFDAIFIDAAHGVDDVMRDIEAWLPKVRSGGLIAGHDADYEAVQLALEDRSERQPRLGSIRISGRCWVAEVK